MAAAPARFPPHTEAVALDDYLPVAGKFKAMKWTGLNTAAFQAWVQTFTTLATFDSSDWSVAFNGHYGVDALTLDWTGSDGFSHLTMLTPSGGWAVFGPWWGTDPTLYWQPGPRTPWTSFTDAEFEREYAAAP